MKYNELDTGIATIFNENYATEYASIFGDTEAALLDTYITVQYGNRDIISTITTDNYKNVISAVIAVNCSDWVKIANSLNAEYSLINGVTISETTNETHTGTNNSSSESNSYDKVYNDTDLNNTSKDNNTATNSTNTDIKSTKTHNSFVGSSVADELEKEYHLRLNNWRKNIIFAIVNNITNSIY